LNKSNNMTLTIIKYIKVQIIWAAV
jgi:hypothetical protein